MKAQRYWLSFYYNYPSIVWIDESWGSPSWLIATFSAYLLRTIMSFFPYSRLG